MKRKSTRKGLVKKLDSLAREVILKRDNYTCRMCGDTTKPTWSHVFTRATYTTRWDTHEGGNCYTHCWPCNYRHVHDQYPMFEWYRKQFGQKYLIRLRQRHKETKRFTMADLETIRERLENELRK